MGSDAEDRHLIIDVLHRLAAILDEREWSRLGEVFTADAVAYGKRSQGLAAIEQSIRAHLGGCGPSQHLLGNHQIEIRGDRATSVTKVRVLHQGRGDRAELTFECLGNYYDEHVRTERGWQIADRRLDVHMSFGDPTVLQPG